MCLKKINWPFLTTLALLPLLLLHVTVPGYSQIPDATQDTLFLNKEFLRAVLMEEFEEAKNYLRQGADINAKNYFGSTALFLAVKQRNLDFTKFLLEHSADINHQNHVGESALMYATSSPGKADVIHLLLKNGADPELTDSKGKTAFIYSLENKQFEYAQLFLQVSGDCNSTLNNGNTLLMNAICRQARDEVVFLLEHGADVNALREDGISALGVALDNADSSLKLDLVKLLLDNGADVNTLRYDGTSALGVVLDGADSSLKLDLVKLLLDNGINVKDRSGERALYYVITMNHVDLTRCLLDKGANPNFLNEEGNYPLLLAVQGTKANEMVPLLLKKGAKTDFTGNHDIGAYWAAVIAGNDEIAEIIKESGEIKKISLKEEKVVNYFSKHLTIFPDSSGSARTLFHSVKSFVKEGIEQESILEFLAEIACSQITGILLTGRRIKLSKKTAPLMKVLSRNFPQYKVEEINTSFSTILRNDALDFAEKNLERNQPLASMGFIYLALQGEIPSASRGRLQEILTRTISALETPKKITEVYFLIRSLIRITLAQEYILEEQLNKLKDILQYCIQERSIKVPTEAIRFFRSAGVIVVDEDAQNYAYKLIISSRSRRLGEAESYRRGQYGETVPGFTRTSCSVTLTAEILSSSDELLHSIQASGYSGAPYIMLNRNRTSQKSINNEAYLDALKELAKKVKHLELE